MTLILKVNNLDMVKMYLYAKNEIPSCSGSQVIAQTDRHTDRLNWNYYLSAYMDDKFDLKNETTV